jgi:hypothetical protein
MLIDRKFLTFLTSLKTIFLYIFLQLLCRYVITENKGVWNQKGHTLKFLIETKIHYHLK